jgi:hypothetical protein
MNVEEVRTKLPTSTFIVEVLRTKQETSTFNVEVVPEKLPTSRLNVEAPCRDETIVIYYSPIGLPIMKKYKDYVPGPDAELLMWLIDHESNYEKMIEATIPGTTQQQATYHLTEVKLLISLLKGVDSAKHTLAGLVGAKNKQKKKVIRMIRDVATIAKRSQTPAPNIIGSMRLVCKPVEFDPAVLAPDISVSCYPELVEVAFDKKVIEGVQVYSRLWPQGEWVLLDTCLLSPYKDTRPLQVALQPERRDYKVIYVNDAGTIGQFSNIFSVVYGG